VFRRSCSKARITAPATDVIQRGSALPLAPTVKQVVDPARTYTSTIETTAGSIDVTLDPERAQVTVNNFVCLAGPVTTTIRRSTGSFATS